MDSRTRQRITAAFPRVARQRRTRTNGLNAAPGRHDSPAANSIQSGSRFGFVRVARRFAGSDYSLRADYFQDPLMVPVTSWPPAPSLAVDELAAKIGGKIVRGRRTDNDLRPVCPMRCARLARRPSIAGTLQPQWANQPAWQVLLAPSWLAGKNSERSRDPIRWPLANLQDGRTPVEPQQAGVATRRHDRLVKLQLHAPRTAFDFLNSVRSQSRRPRGCVGQIGNLVATERLPQQPGGNYKRAPLSSSAMAYAQFDGCHRRHENTL